MKTWATADIVELGINKTEHEWFGPYRDGGYIGDGQISGHHGWDNPNPSPTPDPDPGLFS